MTRAPMALKCAELDDPILGGSAQEWGHEVGVAGGWKAEALDPTVEPTVGVGVGLDVGVGLGWGEFVGSPGSPVGRLVGL